MNPTYRTYTIAFELAGAFAKPDADFAADSEEMARMKAWDSLTAAERDSLISLDVVEVSPDAATMVVEIADVLIGLSADKLAPASHAILAILIRGGILKVTEDREIIWA